MQFEVRKEQVAVEGDEQKAGAEADEDGFAGAKTRGDGDDCAHSHCQQKK